MRRPAVTWLGHHTVPAAQEDPGAVGFAEHDVLPVEVADTAASLTSMHRLGAQPWPGSRCPGRLRAFPTIAVVGLDIAAVRDTVAKAGGLTGTGKWPTSRMPAVPPAHAATRGDWALNGRRWGRVGQHEARRSRCRPQRRPMEVADTAVAPCSMFTSRSRNTRDLAATFAVPCPMHEPDAALVNAVARGHTWFDDLVTWRAKSVNEIAAREGLTPRYVSRVLDLAFLPPTLVEAVLEGRQPVDINAEQLSRSERELLWSDI